MRLTIDSEFQSMIPPLAGAEYDALERSIVAEGGAHTPIDTWRGIVIDGHNRFSICSRLNLPYQTREHTFPDRAAVKSWMFQNQIARRNLSVDQLVMLAVLHDMPLDLRTMTSLKYSRAKSLISAGPSAYMRVLSGAATLASACCLLSPVRARAPRGPSVKPAIPEGHELAGVSTLTDADGSLKAEWNKTRIAGADEAPNDPIPEGHHVVSTSTLLRGDGTTSVQWVTAKADEVRREALIKAAWERHAAVYAGLADVSAAPAHEGDDDLIALYPLGDPHIGMLAWAPESGENFDLKIATRELLACVRLMVQSAPAAKRAIVCNLGDFMHAQSDEQRTPGHGHKLDVDGRYSKVLDAGHALLRGIVDAALEKHEHVTVRNLPGNHDPQIAAELAMWLRAVYERDPRVTVADAYASYQFDRFGVCLFGWAHGDGAKAEALPLLMANAERDAWGATTEHVWHTGHVHHLSRKEYTGCVVETHRTMAGKDFWHSSKGYSAKRSLQMIAYHREYGEVSRNTVGLDRVRAALGRQSVAP